MRGRREGEEGKRWVGEAGRQVDAEVGVKGKENSGVKWILERVYLLRSTGESHHNRCEFCGGALSRS